MKCRLSEHRHALDQESLTFKDNLLIVVLKHGSTEIPEFKKEKTFSIPFISGNDRNERKNEFYTYEEVSRISFNCI